jgi:hypothetical protein
MTSNQALAASIAAVQRPFQGSRVRCLRAAGVEGGSVSLPMRQAVNFYEDRSETCQHCPEFGPCGEYRNDFLGVPSPDEAAVPCWIGPASTGQADPNCWTCLGSDACATLREQLNEVAESGSAH